MSSQSHWDSSYNAIWSKPSFDTEEDKAKYRAMREADAILEVRKPSMPSRQEEVEYIEWLQNDILKDKWVTPRYKHYMAGPKRWARNNYETLDK